MMKVGTRIPNAEVYVAGQDGPSKVATAELLKGKRAVLFSVPGAFTPTCSAKHLPGYVEQIDAFRSKGVDTIACVSVNDVFVMSAWAEQAKAQDSILMIADGNCRFVRAMGLEANQSERGMGWRAQRAAIVLDDRVVTHLFIEPKGSFAVSSADHVLAAL
tara:strand:+ start:6208 stop:6687 length:480 start_codon:yes stop_codon:yes gene_type:complete